MWSLYLLMRVTEHGISLKETAEGFDGPPWRQEAHGYVSGKAADTSTRKASGYFDEMTTTIA